jgi:hypothetical protein
MNLRNTSFPWLPLVGILLGMGERSVDAAVITVSKNGPITTIQAGIDAAADSDTVRVLPGTYAESVVIPLQKFGLTLQGKGKVILDVRGPGGAPLGIGIDIQANSATVRGLTIRNAVGLGLELGDGIRIVGEDVLIEKCVLEANGDSGIRVIGNTARIRKCVFRSNEDGILLQQAEGARIESCAFRSSSGSAIELEQAHDAILDKLTITTNGNGTSISTNNGDSDRVQVTRSAIRLSGDGAVILNGVDCRIANVNVIMGSGGLFIAGDRAVIEKCKVKTVVDGSNAMTISSGVDIRMERNVVTGSSGGSYQINDCTGGVVSDNVAKNTGGDGNPAFEANSSTGLTFEDNLASQVGGDGYFIAGADHVLRDCVAKDVGVDGFDIRPDATNTRLENCVALRCDAEGFENSATAVDLIDCVAKLCRLDLANDGTFGTLDIQFTTGGANVAPEVD